MVCDLSPSSKLINSYIDMLSSQSNKGLIDNGVDMTILVMFWIRTMQSTNSKIEQLINDNILSQILV